MRLAFFSISLICCAALLFGGLPRLLSALFLLPGNYATEYAATGHSLGEASALRAIRSRENSLAVWPARRSFVELGILYHDQGFPAYRDLSERSEFYNLSLDAFRHALTYSPVQPFTWLLMAQMFYELQDTKLGAAQALDWSLRTGHYVSHQLAERASLGLALWDQLAETTRVRLMATITDVFRQDAYAVAAAAAGAGAEDDLRRRLQATHPDGVLLAARFGAATNRFHHLEQQRLAAMEEFNAMRQALIATSIFITASLPTFAEAMSVHEYMEIRSGDHPTRAPDDADEYLSAVLDGLLVLGFFNREEGVAMFCVPDRHVLDINVPEFRANLDSMLQQFATDMPNFDALARTRSVGLVSLEVLSVMYPCDD